MAPVLKRLRGLTRDDDDVGGGGAATADDNVDSKLFVVENSKGS